MPRKQKEESTLSGKETGEEVSTIALANKKTQTEAGHSEPQQNALVQKISDAVGYIYLTIELNTTLCHDCVSKPQVFL